MNGKGRPEKLTDEFRRLITALQEGRKKKLKAPALQQEIRILIKQHIRTEASEKGWSEEQAQGQIEERLPGISSIQKYLGRKPSFDIAPLDAVWHMGTLDDYPLSAEAIRYVFALQEWAEEKNERPITVLHALWISRLYSKICGNKYQKDKLEKLWAYSGIYAWYDRTCKISDIITDTTLLDESVIDLRKFEDAYYSLSAPIELAAGRCSPELFAWLLKKTKDNPELRAELYKRLNISSEKEGEK